MIVYNNQQQLTGHCSFQEYSVLLQSPPRNNGNQGQHAIMNIQVTGWWFRQTLVRVDILRLFVSKKYFIFLFWNNKVSSKYIYTLNGVHIGVFFNTKSLNEKAPHFNYLKRALMGIKYMRFIDYSFNGICGDVYDRLDYETHATHKTMLFINTEL